MKKNKSRHKINDQLNVKNDSNFFFPTNQPTIDPRNVDLKIHIILAVRPFFSFLF